MSFSDLSSPIKIWYKSLPMGNSKWPIVDLKLSCKEKSLPQPVFALIDSGADYGLLHQDVAKALGFDIKKLGAPKISGKSASGVYKSWLIPEPIQTEIYGYSFNFKFMVINNPDLIWPCILGENNIFEIAKIDFQKFKGFFEIRFRRDIN